MTNENETPAYEGGNTIEHDPNENRAPRAGWSLTTKIGVALAAVIGLGAVAAQSAGGFGPGGFGPGGGFHGHHIHKALEKADASQEQEDKIDAIVERTRGELTPLREEFQESRTQLMTLLGAPTVDRAALEKLRAERVASIDAASKKAVAAMADAAEVLTPEQRAKLVTEMRDHIGRRW